MLFTVNKSPLTFRNLDTALGIAPAGEPILLYEDGVYAAVAGSACEKSVEQALADHPVFALREDLEARGLDSLIDGIQVINYDGFVDLVEQHNVVPWL